MDHLEICYRLSENGFDAFIVGGAVRDMLTGIIPHDYDIATNAVPAQIVSVFEDRHVTSGSVGKSFGVTLVDGIEVATFRTDNYENGNGAKNCEIKYAENIHEDISRRDFTINAMAMCPITGHIIDDFGGTRDVENCVIRFVGDAEARIKEDPNRIVRACRFVAKMKGRFAKDTLSALKVNANKVKGVDRERLSLEIMKAMELETPSLFFSALQLIGALKYVFPGMEKCLDHPHGEHHLETVWEHLMIAGDSVSPRFPLVRLAAFLHDVGKPSAFDGKMFVNHENVGASMVDGWMQRLRFSNADREFVSGLVRAHMWGGSVVFSDKAVRRFLFRLNELGVDLRSWMRLRIADRRANLNRPSFTFGDIRVRYNRFVNQKSIVVFNVNSLALKGGDLIRIFSLTPGPIVGRLQKHLLDYVLEYGFEFNNQEDLVLEAKNFLTVNG